MTDASIAPAATPAQMKSRSLLQLAVLRFRRNRAAMFGCLILLAVTLFSFVGPWFVSTTYDQTFRNYVMAPPAFEPRPPASELQGAAEAIAGQARATLAEFSAEGGHFTATLTSTSKLDPRYTRYFDRSDQFRNTVVTDTRDDGKTLVISGDVSQTRFLFGTDTNGRDMVSRIMLGGRISLQIALLASLVSLGIGVLYGATAGYVGGRVDNVMMRFVEVLYSLPFVFLVILLAAFFGASFWLIVLAIGAVEWLDMARIVRGQTLALKRREYVAAAQALGLTEWQIITRHIIPNTIGPVVVFVTVMVPKVILLESFLSFLGLGIQAPQTSWGALISQGADNMQAAPWLLIYPSIFFVATLFALNFIGDGLRDALDPKDR